jgi:hypothetical protein
MGHCASVLLTETTDNRKQVRRGTLVSRFNIGLDLLCQQVRIFLIKIFVFSPYANLIITDFLQVFKMKLVKEMNNCIAGEHPVLFRMFKCLSVMALFHW